ncbi:PHD finger protein PERSISTENT TAPETAL CELL 1 [Ananas comosus]|uniref:PHD finger protein PERSISTENT TAPETAL CELL 1 n=1 Tax=Ananas comosus TaxID=4615 RepID=A0A6P5EPT4_ANACO|nr:PHD finger protein PERSISTENT TAPETAL CELL 1 [Ananas comosus]
MANKMVITLGGSRKRKKRERVFRFETFCEPGHPALFDGSFHENMRALLGFGNSESVAQGEAQCWSFQLELHHHPSSLVRLFIVEEDVEKSPYRHCRLCRFVGWGGNMICNKRFHFVLPKKESTVESEGLSIEIHENGLEKAGLVSKTTSPKRNMMHGLMHSNGFGHIVCINGFEGGSDLVSGHQIVDLWDRICVALRARKISLIDNARKGNMELRLIHGIAYGGTWFGRWGYKFGRGTYGLDQQMYQNSLAALQSLPLYLLVPRLAYSAHEIPMIIGKYQNISSNVLQTLGELFHFMIELKPHLPTKSLTALDYHGIYNEANCRWSMKRVEMATQVIVEALKKKFELKWVTRQEVRDAARVYIGDTGLLDYVLKSLGNQIVGNYIVRRTVNPVTKVLEYCLEDLSNVLPNNLNGNKMKLRFQLTRVQLMRDLLHLYKHILKEPGVALTTGVFGAIPVAVRMVLDTKHFVKDYQDGLQPKKYTIGCPNCTSLNCTIHVKNVGPNEGKNIMKDLPPYETIAISTNATIADLKLEVQRYFSEMYWGLKSFVAEVVVGIGGRDEDLVFGLIESGSIVVVEGRVEGNGGQLETYEGGDNNSVSVECLCGARDEDGERMVCCDICEVWQHTRCVGIPNEENVPHVFLCNRCENGIVSLHSINC